MKRNALQRLGAKRKQVSIRPELMGPASENARRVEVEGRLGREPPWAEFAPPVEPCPCVLCLARSGAVSE